MLATHGVSKKRRLFEGGWASQNIPLSDAVQAAFSERSECGPLVANFHGHARRLGITVERNRRTDLTGFPIEQARLEVAVPTIILTTACNNYRFRLDATRIYTLIRPDYHSFLYRFLRVGVSKLYCGTDVGSLRGEGGHCDRI